MLQELPIPLHDSPGTILEYFELRAVRLMSNNPEKVEAVERAGIAAVERIPCIADAVDWREAYLRTKKEKMRHLLLLGRPACARLYAVCASV
jgi:GTP cyclohydrolase II